MLCVLWAWRLISLQISEYCHFSIFLLAQSAQRSKFSKSCSIFSCHQYFLLLERLPSSSSSTRVKLHDFSNSTTATRLKPWNFFHSDFKGIIHNLPPRSRKIKILHISCLGDRPVEYHWVYMIFIEIWANFIFWCYLKIVCDVILIKILENFIFRERGKEGVPHT